MCRLFGMHAGTDPATATFWLLDAPDSLEKQSRQAADGCGIGVFDSVGSPLVDKQPVAAWQDTEFAQEAKTLRSKTFLAHVRYASTGAHTMVNTHPFVQDGRIFAHNGAFASLDLLDERLAQLGVAALVQGQTDSERMFALITAETRAAKGNVGAGMTNALTWIAEHLPVFSLNLIITTASELWAVRYPATHDLYVLDRPAGGPLEAQTDRIHVRSDDLTHSRVVVVATERMDEDPGWRLLDSGELLHIKADLTMSSSLPFPEKLAHPLTLADLDPVAAAAQGAHP